MQASTMGQEHVTARGFLGLVVADMAIIGVSLVLWRLLWINTHKLSVPAMKETKLNPQDQIFPQESSTMNRIPLTSVWDTLYLLRDICTSFTPSYFIDSLGLEAFMYLAFVRWLVQISGILLFLDICVCIPYIYYFEVADKSSLLRIYNSGNSNFRTTHTIVITIIALCSLIKLKMTYQARIRITMVKDGRQLSLGLSWLRLRTLFVHLQEQNKWSANATNMKNYLQRFLNIECSARSKVCDVVMVSNFGDVLAKQYYREYYEILANLSPTQRPLVWKMFNINDAESLSKKSKEVNKEIESLLYKDNDQVVGAFVVVNTIESVDVLAHSFRLKSDFKCCREGGTFEDDEERPAMLIYSSPNPGDTIWANMSYLRSTIFRQLLINALCIFILLFISTPATVLNLVKIPPVLSTLFLVVTNMLLISVLSFMIQQQNNIWLSSKQIHHFNVLLLYLVINMILVSIARGIKTLSDFLLEKEGWQWIQVFEMVYQEVDGYFFCLIFFNQTAISFFMYLVKPRELFYNFASARLYLEKLGVHTKTMYGKNLNFRFGEQYAMLITLFIISMIYASSIPVVHLFSLVFFVCRLYLDSYTLLAFHKEETISMGKLSNKVLLGAGIAVAVQVFLVANSLLIELRYINAIILYILLIGSFYVCRFLNEPLVGLDTLAKDNGFEEGMLRQEHLCRWREMYSYPLNF